MDLWILVAALSTITAGFSYLNDLLLHLPSGIGVMCVALIFSLALLGLLKRLQVPKDLEMKIAGESLFNDVVAVTLFLLLLPLVGDGPAPGLPDGGAAAGP